MINVPSTHSLALVLILAGFTPLFAGPLSDEKILPRVQQDELLRKLETGLKASRTFHAAFVQEKHLSIFQDVLVSSGTLDFAAPSSMRWEINYPFHSLLIMDGHVLSKYDFPQGKARKLNLPATEALSEVLGQITSLHQGKFSDQTKNYDIVVYSGKSVRVVLTPKSKKMRQFIPGIELGFSEQLNSVSTVLINEKDGDFTLIKFVDVKLNPEPHRELFAPEAAK